MNDDTRKVNENTSKENKSKIKDEAQTDNSKSRMTIKKNNSSFINQVAFVLTIIAIILSMVSYDTHLDILVKKTDSIAFVFFIITSGISIVLTILSFSGYTSQIYMLHIILAFRFVLFLVKYFFLSNIADDLKIDGSEQ